jgi:hypothetical protein
MRNFVTEVLFRCLLVVQYVLSDSRVEFTECGSPCGGRNGCCFRRMGVVGDLPRISGGHKNG